MTVLAGAVITLIQFIRERRAEYFLILGLAFLPGLALLYYSLKIPVYASAKAFYASAALVSFCALGAVGWDFLTRRAGRLRFVLQSGLLVWALMAYSSFWIRKDAVSTQLRLAQASSSEKQYDQAVHQLSEILQRDPQNAAAAQLMAVELTRESRLPEARLQVEGAVRRFPEDAENRRVLANVLVRQGHLDEAILEVRRAVELSPDDFLARRDFCVWLYQAKRREEAVVAFKEALGIEPADADLHYALAWVLADQADQTNAAVHFRFAAALKPEWAEAHYQLGLSLAALNQPEGAGGELAQAVRLKPQNTMFRHRLALHFRDAGRMPEAIGEFRRVIHANPAFAPALNDLAWILATQNDPQFRNGSEAVQLATQACDLSGRKAAPFLETLAAAYAETGRFDDAITAARQALDLARAEDKKEDLAQAEKILSLFVARQPCRLEQSPPHSDSR